MAPPRRTKSKRRTYRKRAVWVIRDGPRKLSTGCAAKDRAGAERVLGEHLANKYQPNQVRGRHPSQILIADVLAIYLTDVAPKHAREEETKQRVLTLDSWWGERTLADVNGANCRAYVQYRVSHPLEVRKTGEDWEGAQNGDRGGGSARTRRYAGGDQPPPSGRALLGDRIGRAAGRGPTRANGGLPGPRQGASSGLPGGQSRSCATRIPRGPWAGTLPALSS